MKNIAILALSSIIFISCKSNIKHPSQNSTSKKPNANLTKNALSQKFKPIIQGVWVKSNYVEDLTLTKSPYKSRKKLAGIASIIIDLSSEIADSVVAGASLNNHEGSNLTIFFKTGKKTTSLKTNLKDYRMGSNFFELGYNIKGRDTCLLLYHYNKNNHLIDSVKYTRVLTNCADNDAACGITYITNKRLVTGKYNMTDSAGNFFNIAFDSEGKITGLPGFKTYYINTDFEAGPENNLDQLSFDIQTKQQKDFLFKLNADTLNIYDINKSADSINLEWGRLRYKLLKNK